jgi:hypothetical protein
LVKSTDILRKSFPCFRSLKSSTTSTWIPIVRHKYHLQLYCKVPINLIENK